MGGWFFAIVVVAVAALFADRLPAWFRRVLLFVMAVVIGFTVAEIASGVLRLQFADHLQSHEFHRWTAHGLVIAHWTILCIGIGAAIATCARQRWLLAASIASFPVIAFGFSLVASFTGYLHPRSVEETHELQRTLNEETMNRFIVLHAVVLPIALLSSQLAIVAAVWRLPASVPVALPTRLEEDEPV